MKRFMLVAGLLMLIALTGCKGGDSTNGAAGTNGTNGTNGTSPPVYASEILKAANHLVNTQNSDGGWNWQITPNSPVTPSLPSPYNTLGVTAQGVLDAYKISPQAQYLSACVNAYGLIVTNSTNANPSVHRIRGTDITFLVELSEVTGTAAYANFAKTRYESALTEFGGGNAKGLATYVQGVRVGQGLPDIVAWDINLYVQGALALNRYFPGQGFDADAAAMTGVIYTALYVSVPPAMIPVFDISSKPTGTPTNDYWMAVSGAVEAFVTTATYTTESTSLITNLLTDQQQDGHFIGNGDNDQTTAYAVTALAKAGNQIAAEKAVGYLTSTQNTNGGWTEVDGYEYTETDSEINNSIVAGITY